MWFCTNPYYSLKQFVCKLIYEIVKRLTPFNEKIMLKLKWPGLLNREETKKKKKVVRPNFFYVPTSSTKFIDTNNISLCD